MTRNSCICCALVFVFTMFSSVSCAKRRNLDALPKGKFVRYAEDLSIGSNILGKNVSFNILLPEDYLSSPKKRYPVIYMLHGLGDNRKSWNSQYLRVENKVKELEAQGLEPMIYIFPDGYNSYYCNTYDSAFKYMDMFIDELVPHIDKTYRTIADREHRAAIGYSMGGFGAMILPLKNPDVFSLSIPLSMSFRTDEQYMTEGPQSGWDKQWGFIFGGLGQIGLARLTEYYKGHSPFYQFVPENKLKLSTLSLFLHCGDDEEQLLIANDDLHVQLRENGYEHEYRVADGGHTGAYWEKSLNEVLPYVQFIMNGGGDWKFGTARPGVKNIVFKDDGAFASEGFENSPKEDVKAVYLVHSGLERSIVESFVSVLTEGVPPSKKYIVFPCDITKKTLLEWIESCSLTYSLEDNTKLRFAIALGDAGKEVHSNRNKFSKFYFDNASLPDNNIGVLVETSNFYYISQTDDGPYYKDMGGLYKVCKTKGAAFQYRVRNGSGDAFTDLLAGAKDMKPYINY